MQQVNLPKNNATSQSQNTDDSGNIKQANTKPAISNDSPAQSSNPISQSDSNFMDPWGMSDPWSMMGNENSANSSSSSVNKRMTPDERIQMIESVYEEVLNRKPDTRDINYYKYSTLQEDEIRKQLLKGKEHKQLIADGIEYKKMRAKADQAETRVTMLESQIKDQVVEFRQLTELLKEKNRYINELRNEQQNPYNLTTPSGNYKAQFTHYSPGVGQVSPTSPQVTKNASNSTGPEYVTPTPIAPQSINDTYVTEQNSQSETVLNAQVPQSQPQAVQISAAKPQFSQDYSAIPTQKKKGVLDYVKDIFSV